MPRDPAPGRRSCAAGDGKMDVLVIDDSQAILAQMKRLLDQDHQAVTSTFRIRSWRSTRRGCVPSTSFGRLQHARDGWRDRHPPAAGDRALRPGADRDDHQRCERRVRLTALMRAPPIPRQAHRPVELRVRPAQTSCGCHRGAPPSTTGPPGSPARSRRRCAPCASARPRSSSASRWPWNTGTTTPANHTWRVARYSRSWPSPGLDDSCAAASTWRRRSRRGQGGDSDGVLLKPAASTRRNSP